MTDDPTDPGWAMDRDGPYWSFVRDGRLHVLESDGTPKFIGRIDSLAKRGDDDA